MTTCGCAIDWKLVLEFVKVLAVPLATVAVAFIVSSLGIRAFKKQKALEHRIHWYEESYRLLDRAMKAVVLAALYPTITTPEARARLDDAMKASTSLGDHLAQSWLYAEQDVHQAVADFGQTLETVHRNVEQLKAVSRDDASAYVDACLRASFVFASGIRKELGVSKLDPPRRSPTLGIPGTRPQ
jgi:hypothetical protein